MLNRARSIGLGSVQAPNVYGETRLLYQSHSDKMNKETVLYGLPKGETERYTEVLLLTNATPELIERVKVLASKDGFHSFRVATIDLSVVPNFAKTVR